MLVRDEHGVATVTFDSPPLNLLNRAMFAELRSVLAQLGRDAPRAVVFRAAGRVVSAGVDVRVFYELPDPAAAEAFIAQFVSVAEAVERLACPTVFAAHGLCLTWAFELVLACDLIVAAERASFGLTERTIGLTPCMGGVQRFAERAGTARASQAVLTGQRFSASTLERWNVVNLVVPDAGFAEQAQALVADLAQGPTRAHVATKSLIRRFREGGVPLADRSTPEVAGALFASDDLRRGGAVVATRAVVLPPIVAVRADDLGRVRQVAVVLTGGMRESENVQRGNRGEAAVMHAFMQLGWPSANAPGSDLGTDLFLMVRERRFDLGLLVGAQVKSGSSWFREPARDDAGEVIGWWFRDDDREHVDYWLTHTLPHLIVLHDLDTGTSYWCHITSDAVVSTGKGAKILVPREKTIDPDHFHALLAVAATARPKSTWEGSVWADASNIIPADMMRHALLVPRLVAPHRNAGYSVEVGPEQVVALLVEGHLRDVEIFANRHSSVLTLEDAKSASDWRWRLAHAIGVRVTSDSVDPLLTLVTEVPTPYALAAATVAAAAGLLEQARPDEALPLLQAALDGDASSPIDHAWLLVQRARAHRELGRLELARADASEALRAKLSYGSDVTASAVAGVAAGILWSISRWNADDLQETITGLDTLAAWWRTQCIAAGSNAVIGREFRTWAQDRSIRFSENVANNRLYAGALLASQLGDHSAWRLLSSLNAQQRFLCVSRTADIDQVRGFLSELRNAGDHKALKLAVQHLLSEGPAEAVTVAANDVDLRQWTHSNAHANLTLFGKEVTFSAMK